MRFIEHGPDIPDELLLALDEGKVMFFCGAGVSQEDADLPDFLGLAKRVLKKLGVSKKDSAYKILKEVPKIDKRTGVSGLVSSDRIFGQLEKDFSTKRIETVVAELLKPPDGVVPKAHQTLLDLSTKATGHVRLVTTNFDRLFEECDENLKTWQPPRLPDSSEITNFEGLVYLHGRVNKKYNDSDNGFVLSSSGFGRAYLADGWATRFFKEIISEYVVVFVGYAADDPPIHYLLEAFNKTKGKSKEIYAFECGTVQEASAKWQHKGVTAISYDKYETLWNTLDAWAGRAKDLKSWQDDIINEAQKGPERLLPFQREQVAHLVSTSKGAQRFCASDNPPPATWLCVFDSAMRFKMTTKIKKKNDTEIPVDFLDNYGLASDPVPELSDSYDYLARRDVPQHAWDIFLPNTHDEREVESNYIAPVKGGQALSVKTLPNRLYALGAWIAKISDQNAAIWWAVRQDGIHQQIQERIRLSLQDKTDIAPHIAKAWHYLFDSLNIKPSEMETHVHDWFLFKKDIKKFGWNILMVKRYEEMAKPRMTVQPEFWNNEIPPQKDVKTDFGQLVDLSVLYKKDYRRIDIPDEYLANVVAALRRNLDIAIRLEIERGYYPYIQIPPIIPSDDPNISSYARRQGFAPAVLHYVPLFERLLKLNPKLAQAEVEKWGKDDDNLYARLRIWSGRFVKIVTDDDVGNFLSVISRNAFWQPSHQRDLLHTLKARWTRMPVRAKYDIEKRILHGPEQKDDEKKNKYTKRKAQFILERLDWLKDAKCDLSATTKKKIARLKKANPDYKDKHAKDADKSHENLGGMVRTNTDPDVLLNLPLADILPKAEEEMKRRDDFLVEYDPFAGLCETRPARAFAALRYEAKQNTHRSWAWRNFLYHEKRKKDSAHMKRLIAESMFHMPDEKTVETLSTLAQWVSRASMQLAPICIPIFERLIKRLAKILTENHARDNFTAFKVKEKTSDFDWNMHAINSASGDIAETLFHDPRIKKLKAGQPFPSDWIKLVESMLALPDDLGRYALLIFTYRLDWFYYVNPQWTDDNLLQPLFDGNPDTVEAWWGGYLWGVKHLDVLTLFTKIKPYLLKRASNQSIQTRHDSHMMPQFILLNWAHKDNRKQRISNSEFRDILLNASDAFRVRILWEIGSFCEKDTSPPHWNKKRLALLEKVWPEQEQVQTPGTSERLIDLAFANEPEFPRIAKAIIPLLGESFKHSGWSFLHGDNKDRIVDKHPEIVLEILYKVVPEDVFLLSDRVKNTLDRIATADPELTRDPRFKELQRRWAAR